MREWFDMMRGVAWYLLTWPWQEWRYWRSMRKTGTEDVAGGYEESWKRR